LLVVSFQRRGFQDSSPALAAYLETAVEKRAILRPPMVMKSVVMIAYYFPPEGSAGVYRPLRFVRHLPTLGWGPTVISLDTNSYERYDPELLTQIPPETQVIRVQMRDPWQDFQQRREQHIKQRPPLGSTGGEKRDPSGKRMPLASLVKAVIRTVEVWCYHPDTAMMWIRPAIDAIISASAYKPPDVIWATAGPISAFFVAQRVSQRLNVPYVLDFRDPRTITCTEFEIRRPAWARRRDRRGLYGLLKGAQAVVFRYQTEAECFWQAYAGAFDAARVHIIPNGYDGSIDESVPVTGEKCTLLYTGTLSSYRFDTLLHALQSFKCSDPARAKLLHLLFVGEGTEALARDSTALGLSDMITTLGPISYAQTARLHQEAHAFLVLGRQPTMRGYELLAGAKLYSYLKTRRPIVGVVPQDETKRTLQRIGASTVADVDSPAEIVAVLQQLVEAWSSGGLSTLTPDKAACEVYSGARQTAALVRALEAASASEPFVPGSADIPPSLRDQVGQWSTAAHCQRWM
jgi:glycosyltransferase involved in cell wall biosynthesis